MRAENIGRHFLARTQSIIDIRTKKDLGHYGSALGLGIGGNLLAQSDYIHMTYNGQNLKSTFPVGLGTNDLFSLIQRVPYAVQNHDLSLIRGDYVTMISADSHNHVTVSPHYFIPYFSDREMQGALLALSSIVLFSIYHLQTRSRDSKKRQETI